MKSATLIELVSFLDELLDTGSYSDASLNGLQVESPRKEVRKVAFAVDSGELVLAAACQWQANLLIVHHGLLWGALERIEGPLARKLSMLLTQNCSLYASHLPLDGNITVGNGAELARLLALKNIQPAFNYRGSMIGVTAESEQPITIEQLIDRSRALKGAITPTIIAAGSGSMKKIGIVTGSGTFAIPEAKKLGLDLLISGEAKQEAFHLAHEMAINALFLGHYATETLGVLALQGQIERQFSLETKFIDIPTGI